MAEPRGRIGERGAAERAARRIFAVSAVVLAAIAAGIRVITPPGTLFGTIAGASHVLLMALALVFIGMLIVRLSRELDSAAAGRAAASAAAAAASGRLAAQTRTAALVHDEVLSTLRVAAFEAVDRAAVSSRAAAALTRVRGLADRAQRPAPWAGGDGGGGAGVAPGTDAGAEIVALVRAAVEEIDPATTIDISGPGAWSGAGMPPEVRRAVLGALAQALDNSLRHAGAGAHRRLELELDGAALRLTLSDDGAGFDPAAVPTTRLGVRTSIVQAMRDIEGSARIDSAPGAGTRVALTWEAETSAPLAIAPDRRTLRTGIAVIAFAFLGTQLPLAAYATVNAEPWWLPLLCVAVLFAAAEVLRRSADTRVSPARSTGVLALILAAVAIGMLGSPFSYGDLWFLMAAALILAACVIRGNLVTALGGGLLTIGGVALWGAVDGVDPRLIASVVSRPIAVLVLAVAFTAVVQRMQRRTAAEHERAVAETARAAWTASEAAERAAKAAEMVPLTEHMLERIASGAPLTAEDRGRAQALDGLLRDRLRAGRLAVDAVLEAAMRARAQGVYVVLLDDHDGEPAIDLAAADDWIAARIDAARERVTVRLLPAGRSAPLSVMVDGAPVPLPAAIAAA